MENKLEIVFENDKLFVVNKPSGVVVNRSDTTSGNTLQDLIEGAREISHAEEPEFIDRSGIVHRLDKETSGVIIVAKDSESFRALQAQFKERLVEKEYIALSHGKIKPGKGEIRASIGRLPWNRKRFGVLAGGREANTFYEVENYYKLNSESLTLVNLFPKTGRTHQIRVHLKHIGNPIFSDELYAGRKVARNDRKLLGRVFLHAKKISFIDPVTEKKVSCEAKLPTELVSLLEKLEEDSIIK